MDKMKLPKGFKLYDGKRPLTLEEDADDKLIAKSKEFNESVILNNLRAKDTGVYDLKNFEFSKDFCVNASSGLMPQFETKLDYLKERLRLMIESKIYKFKNQFTPLIVQNNKNDWGYRPMRQNNMFIEVGLDFGKVFVAGIHLHKVFLRPEEKGKKLGYQVYSDRLVPADFTEEGISIFISGIGEDNVVFYSYFTLRGMDKGKLEHNLSRYSCPYCQVRMNVTEAGSNLHYCDQEHCVNQYQGGETIAYDLSNKKLRHTFRVMKMQDVWSIQDKVRNFVCNFLDFLNTPEVIVRSHLDSESLHIKNVKRAKRGKKALPPINLILVDGYLKKYINDIESLTGSINVARNETWVSGHYMRFWMKEKWTNIYSWINKCKTDEDIKERLAKYLRKDGDGKLLPKSQQYIWDSYYKVIKVWKIPFIKFKGEGTPKDSLTVVKV